MGWIKRNIIFVASAILALGLLGGAGYYIYLGWSRNGEKSQQLNDIYAKLSEIAKQSPQPGNNKTDNIAIAKEQEQQLRAWINGAAGNFHPVPPIPRGEVTSKTYASALGTTIYQLQQAARENSVGFPTNYYFSFQVQSSKLTISSGLGPLAQQLGEVKAIADVLFAARVNNLDSIQRVRVSDDDVNGGLQSDYIDKTPITNDLAIITPYVATFQCFTPELARVISGFATSTNPFVVKSVSVQPANASGTADNAAGGQPPPPQIADPYGYNRYGNVYRGRMMTPGMPPQQPANAPAPGKGGLQTVLKEQLLRVTVEVDIVKLLPKS
jgi:hypothetical protein